MDFSFLRGKCSMYKNFFRTYFLFWISVRSDDPTWRKSITSRVPDLLQPQDHAALLLNDKPRMSVVCGAYIEYYTILQTT